MIAVYDYCKHDYYAGDYGTLDRVDEVNAFSIFMKTDHWSVSQLSMKKEDTT